MNPEVKRPRLQRLLRRLLFGCMFVALAGTAFAAGGVSTPEGPQGPAQTAYAPAKGGPGPIVIVISGKSGPDSYQYYAEAVANLGYYAVLLDGNDILIAPHKGNPNYTGSDNLRKAIDRAQKSADAVPGKVAVIGFSLGGGAALFHATAMAKEVSMVAVYYPFTRAWAGDMGSFVKRFKVPVLVLAGAMDHYHDCCVVESMRAMEVAAQTGGAQFELVVYPEADHGFNLRSGAPGEPAKAFRAADALDAWHHTVALLKFNQPLP